ncbi:MAG: hypothetical protein A2Y77_15900 [Planctomycetes bacterium RBG_13_62_9]|nr:MAG: hypothetical protein A2Y77_15900 [Planctomycetes bacterium RBG_13_62_9]
MQAELEFLPGISPREGAVRLFCRGATMMRRMKAMSLSVFLAFSGGVTATEEKGDPVQFGPKEIRVELSREEAQVSGGRQWGKIMILDAWDYQLRITDIQTSPNVMAMVYDLTHRQAPRSSRHMFRIETRLKPVERVGLLEEWVKVSTNHPDFATIRIPLTYRISGSIRAIPRTLVVNRSLGHSPLQKVRLTTSAKAGLEIDSTTAADTWVSVTSVRFDPNTIDLAVSLSEPAAGDIARSAITVRAVRPQATEITIPVVVLPQVAWGELGIVPIIAMSNRLNRELAHSFRCEWTSTRQAGTTRRQTHEYAFSGDREWLHVQNAPPGSGFVCYVRNGLHARSTSSSGAVWLNTTATMRPLPDLFTTAGATGAGVIPHLDKLDPKYDRVTSVREASLEGRRCVVVTIEQQRVGTSAGDEPDRVLTIYFSVEDGFLPIRVEDRPRAGSGGTKSFARDATVTKILKYPLQGSTFYVPAAFHHETYRDGRLDETTRYEVDEGSVEVNTRLPDDLFRIEVGPTDAVLDRDLARELTKPIISMDFFGAKTGLTGPDGRSTEAAVLYGQEFAGTWDAWLVGKPLPSWEGIRLALDNESIKDRAALVLFWDVNQRPSRRCMDLLAGKAESLRRADVVAIAIQAAKADESSLHEWIKNRSIPCSVGMIVGDAEKVRSAWAVQSLPWLILTDRQHRVRAEGFSIEKLTDVLSVLSAPRPE